MARALKWIAIAAGVVLLLLGSVVFVLHRWLGTDDFRDRVASQASAALGVPLVIGTLSIDVWPLPAVAVSGLQLGTQPPVTLDRVEARPVWAALIAGRLEIATLIVRDAVVPQQGIAALVAAMQKKQGAAPATAKPDPASPSTLSWVPRRALLERVTWIDDKGARTTLDAQARLDDQGVLSSASFKILQGRFAGAQGKLRQDGDGWPVELDIGGGKVAGRLQLSPAAAGARTLKGQLAAEGVEVAVLTAPSKVLAGKLQAQTTLEATFKDPGDIGDALRTQTRFSVKNAVVHGIDLAQAVTTAGLSRGGETRLDALAGQVTTRGRSAELNNLVASSGVLAATGHVALAPNRALSGRVTVELASTKGAVGVPLVVGGTIDAPSVNLTRGAMLGAAIGTLVAPGVGTGAGATMGDRIGDKLKGLFGR